MLSAFQNVAQETGCPHTARCLSRRPATAESECLRSVLRAVHPGVLWGKPPAFPSSPQRDVDVAREQLEKRQRGFAVGTRRKQQRWPRSHSGDQGHVLQVHQGQRPIPQNTQQSPQGIPPHGPWKCRLPREEESKTGSIPNWPRLNEKWLIVLNW